MNHGSEDDMQNSTANRVTLFEGKHLRLVRVGHWEHAERTITNGAVMILAVTRDQKLILIEQFRLPLGKPVIELPAGLAGDILGEENEALTTAAQRELREETGYEAREFVHLVTGPPSAGLSSETVAMFRALDVRHVAPGGGDEHENIQVHEIPLAKVDDWLAQKTKEGALIDPKVYAGLYFARKNTCHPPGECRNLAAMNAEARIAELKLELPPAPKPVGVYKPVVIVGNLAYVSGHGPLKPDKSLIKGRVGQDLDLPGGKLAARQVGLAILASVREHLGSLNRVKRVIKTLGMVNSTADFQEHPAVINGCSELFAEVFGPENGIGARSAVGMGSLPGNIAVEIEVIFEIE
jgi:enamine deaminase RidA (YjgF/YER057c/UK114 family)/8-oxo-dGTP pyrophosphatase MutT (NUDIX family)